MAEDVIEEIDAMLTDTLPENPHQQPERVTDEQKEELVRLLRYASEELGESPSANEFNSLDLGLSARKIQQVFGSWNDAKREAGLETYEVGGGKSGTLLNASYFDPVETAEQSYWLGTLFATSSVQYVDENSAHVLILGRIREKDHFVTGFAESIESEYSIQTYQNQQTNNEQVSLQITDSTFIGSLFDLGYPEPDGGEYRLPELPTPLQPAFLRGYVEADTRSFTGSPIRISGKNRSVAETVQRWLGTVGVKNHSVTERASDGFGVNVSNAFNIKTMYEELWPDRLDTEPSYRPYPESVLAYLENEYPYPENVAYLSE